MVNPTIPQPEPIRGSGLPMPVLGVYLGEEVPSSDHVYALASGTSSVVEIGPLSPNSIYEFTFFASSAGAIDSGTTPPDVYYVISNATGATVTAGTSTAWPSSSYRVMQRLFHHDQTYIKFMNCSGTVAALICVAKLR